MKGYIVGYFGTWADSRNPIIVGYYTNWSRSLSTAIELERYNIDKEKGLQEIYIVDIDVNRTYNVKKSDIDWINNFVHYKIKTIRGKTILYGPKGETVLNMPESTVWQEAKRRKIRKF